VSEVAAEAMAPRVLNNWGEVRGLPEELTPEQLDSKRRIRKAVARLGAEYGAAGLVRRRVAAVAGRDRDLVARLYPEDADLLMDVLVEHVWGLNGAVCKAFDADHVGPFERLEAVIRAWLDHVAGELAEHRCLLFCVRLLPEAMRQSVMLKYRIVLETVVEALGGVAPGRDLPVESLLGTARALLSDVGWWPDGLTREERARAARRIAGMLAAAAEAEMAGEWRRGCPTAGVVDGRVYRLEVHVARARFSEVLDALASGAEIVVTRRGKYAARLVGMG
jgi:prevent-host-death family protein